MPASRTERAADILRFGAAWWECEGSGERKSVSGAGRPPEIMNSDLDAYFETRASYCSHNKLPQI